MVSTKQGTGWLIGVNRRPYYVPLATAILSQNWEPRIGTGVLSWKLPFTSKFRVFFPTSSNKLQDLGSNFLMERRETDARHFDLPGIRTDSERCPAIGWRPFKAKIFEISVSWLSSWDLRRGLQKVSHIWKDCLTVKIQKPFCLIFCDFILWIFSHCFRKNGRSFMFRFSGFNAQASGQCLCTRNGSNDQHTARKIGGGAS